MPDPPNSPAPSDRVGADLPPRVFCAVVLLVVLLAVGLRLIYLSNIKQIGFFDHPVSDAYVYDQRARGIADGDWLGPADFVHAPLYAYVLGVIRIMGGHDLWWPRLVQVVFGAMSCALLMLAGRRFFGARIALLAGVLLACYPPAIFFDGLIQKTSLALLLSTLLLWLLTAGLSRSAWWRWALSGAVLGLLALTRQNALALVPLVVLWILLTGKRSGNVIAGLAACLAALVLVLSPWALRNRIVTGEFVLTTPNLGQNFAMGNHPQATGTYLPFKRGRATAEHEQQEWVRAAERATGAARGTMSARAVSDYYLDAALAYIKTDPGAWLKLMLKKTLMTIGAHEAPDTEDYYLYQEWSPLLRGLDRVWHFGVLAPLAAAGLVLTRSDWRKLWLLYGWGGLTVLAVAAFVVFARYRFPLVPVLILFAAAAMIEGANALWKRQFRRTLASIIAVILTALIVNWPVHLERRTYPVSYTNHAVALADEGRCDDALRELDKALALAPDDVDAHLVRASILIDLGEYDSALTAYDRAQQGAAEFGGVYRGQGNALLRLGRFGEAAEQYERALAIEADDYVALNGLATATAAQGRLAEAFEMFARVLDAEPDYPEAHLSLGNAYLAAGRLDEAARVYEHVLDLDPRHADAWHNLGITEVQRGRLPRAIDCFRKVLELQPTHHEARRALAAALRQTGQ